MKTLQSRWGLGASSLVLWVNFSQGLGFLTFSPSWSEDAKYIILSFPLSLSCVFRYVLPSLSVFSAENKNESTSGNQYLMKKLTWVTEIWWLKFVFFHLNFSLDFSLCPSENSPAGWELLKLFHMKCFNNRGRTPEESFKSLCSSAVFTNCYMKIFCWLFWFTSYSWY